MKQIHHKYTVQAAIDLLALWEREKKLSDKLKPVHALMQGPSAGKMSCWAAQPDDLRDVVLEGRINQYLMEQISHPTSFQHFAYSGALGELRDGKTVVRKYDGYCWDCDPYLGWLDEVGDVSWVDVHFNPDCKVFNREFWQGSPGAEMISGHRDWDNQLYPSALDMAEFYGQRAIEYKGRTGPDPERGKEMKDWSLQSACFAIHMLQDLTSPHHIMCTIMSGHPKHEMAMRRLWERAYVRRSERAKRDALSEDIGPMVAKFLDDELARATTYRAIGERTIELTQARMPSPDRMPADDKIQSKKMTALGIACCVKALELYCAETSV